MRLTLSIVTPSYNQGRFIAATIDSVLSQSRPPEEYLVMDGGSKDETVDVLQSYGNAIKWVSEKDNGQADAVNKGIKMASGDIIGWINSDDIYYPGAFDAVMDVFENHPEVNIVYGKADHIREDGSYLEDYYTEKWNYERLKEICYICQPSVFFRKETVLKYGLLDSSRQFAMDYDLWLRMGKDNNFYLLNKKIAGSRLYGDNKTLGQVEKVHIDIMNVLRDNLGYVPDNWIEGSAHSIARAQGFSQNGQFNYHWYKTHVASMITDFTKKYNVNPEGKIQLYPYKYGEIKIGIDISRTMIDGAAGVAYYTESLTESLMKLPIDNQILLYSAFYECYPIGAKGGIVPSHNAKKKYCPVKNQDVERLRRLFSQGTREQLLEELEYPDVVVCPAFSFSRNLAKAVATVYILYDVSFLEHPEYTTKENWNYCFEGMYNATLYADIFLAISDSTKERFLKYFPYVDEKRIFVIPAGYRSCFVEPVNCEKELKALKIDPESPFWLCVGTVEPRKNLISLIRAYSELKKQEKTYPLYIAGGRGWLESDIYAEVEKQGLQDDIVFLGYVSDAQLTALYRSCYATVYPSYYEGFGLPVLEAMAAGAPVISSNSTSLPEVGGDDVLYIDPYREETITEAMEKLQNEKELRDNLAERGHKRAITQFSWSKCAEITYKMLYEAIRHFDKKRQKNQGE